MKNFIKVIIILFFSICMTGCNTEATVYINSDEIEEVIYISDNKSNVYDLQGNINESIKSSVNVFEREFEYYNKEDIVVEDNIKRKYNFKMSIDDWRDFSILRKCYDDVNIRKSNTRITVNATGEYRCGYMFDANNVTLNIVSDLTLYKSNADKIEGNRYTWYLNKDNYKNKSIYISYNLNEEDKINQVNNSNSVKENNSIDIFIILLISILIIICGIVIYIKVKNSNK